MKIAGALDPDNSAFLIAATPDRPFGWHDRATRLSDFLWMAGGKSLGTIDHYATPNYKHGIAGGKVEIVGTVKPEFVWNNIDLSVVFKIQRNVLLEKFWDNGQHCTVVDNLDDPTGDPRPIVCKGNWVAGPTVIENTNHDLPNDSSDSDKTDLIPFQNGGKIFDLDIPACPPHFQFSIQHTAEAYMNFEQWVEANLGDGKVRCSDIENWSYKARVDGDAKVVAVNELSHTHIPAAEMISHFDPR